MKVMNDIFKASAALIGMIISVCLFMDGANVKDGESFSLNFFLGIVLGIVTISYIRKWLREEEDAKSEDGRA